MKSLLVIVAAVFFSSRVMSQQNFLAYSQMVLNKNEAGVSTAFSRTSGVEKDSLVLTYLGTVKDITGRRYKVLTSIWFWGISSRATSRIILFDMKNAYIGDFHLTMIDELPVRIVDDKLVFNCKKMLDAKTPLEFEINFSNGIPSTIFLYEDDKHGSEYEFARNL